MHLQFDYQMEIRYSKPVERCYYTIKCIPKESARQKLVEKTIRMEPESCWAEGTDGWGNPKLYGHISKPHDIFRFQIEGTVESLPEQFEEETGLAGMYRQPFGKTIPGSELFGYFNSLDHSGYGQDKETCSRIMDEMRAHFSYEKEQTEAGTTAEQAWRLGKGVCQDYAHIYLALLRMAGIPARYVCGLMEGEGESHAWVEALLDGKWVGIDPTNCCPAGEGYIKLGDGRDASECAINRGILFNGGEQSQIIRAVVRRIEKDKEDRGK